MEELIDVLDENGNKTGIIKTRKEVHTTGEWHKVAFIFVVNSKGEIILQKRSAEKSTNPNKWTASASGHLTAGDSDIEGALRELEEEIGVKAKPNELKYLFTAKLKRKIDDKNFSHIQDIYVLYKDINIDELVLQEEEVSEAKYVYYKDFEKMIKEENNELVEHNEIYPGVLEELYKKFQD